VAPYTVQGSTFEPGKPRVWSPRAILRTGVVRNLDLHPDGKRFLVFPRPAESPIAEGNLQLTFILNFGDELKRRVP
jgi:hypothetical protein